MARLCLCVNQIAKIRNLNRAKLPDPIAVAMAAELGGVDGIIVFLRDDRSDITDRDVFVLKEVLQSHLNLAIPLNDAMIKKSLKWLPDMVTLLPATDDNDLNRSLDVVSNLEYIEDATTALRANNIIVNVLIDPAAAQIRAAAKAGVDYVNFNSNPLGRVEDLGSMNDFIEKMRTVAIAANKLGLGISAGRSLSIQTLREVGQVEFIEEVNVGRALVARSLLVGIEKAVEQTKVLLAK
jgi:pyridoxine 5-phosphate synthase